MAQNSGILIPSAIDTPDSADTFPTHYSSKGKGGWREVADLTARDAVPTARRVEGMAVYVQSNDTVYVLKNGITNSNWVEFTSGGGSNETGAQIYDKIHPIIDIVPPVTQFHWQGYSVGRSLTEGAWDKDGVKCGQVRKIGDTYFMFYAGARGYGPPYYSISIPGYASWETRDIMSTGLATSTDKKTWTKHGEIIPIPADMVFLFPLDIVIEGGTCYLLCSGPYKDPSQHNGDWGWFGYYYTTDLTMLGTWTKGVEFRRYDGAVGTGVGAHPYGGNDSICRDDDGYWYLSYSDYEGWKDYNNLYEQKIRLLKTTINTGFSTIRPQHWQTEWDAGDGLGVREHVVLDNRAEPWVTSGFNIIYDSKIFRVGHFWALVVGGAKHPAMANLPNTADNFTMTQTRIFYATKPEGPYRTFGDAIHQAYYPIMQGGSWQDAIDIWLNRNVIPGWSCGRSMVLVDNDSTVDLWFDVNLVFNDGTSNSHVDGTHLVHYTSEQQEGLLLPSHRLNNSLMEHGNIRLSNQSIDDEIATIDVRPDNGTDVAGYLRLIPRGNGGYSGYVRSAIVLHNKDAYTDPVNMQYVSLVNYEDHYSIQSGSVGTGTCLPIKMKMVNDTTNDVKESLTITPNGGVYIGTYTQGVTTDVSNGDIVAYGSVTANHFHGDGSQLTGIQTSTNVHEYRNVTSSTAVLRTDGVITFSNLTGDVALNFDNTQSGGGFLEDQYVTVVNRHSMYHVEITPTSPVTVNDSTAVTITMEPATTLTLHRAGTSNNWVAATAGSGGGGVTDHGALTGLSDDDHSQYALLAGRSGTNVFTGNVSATTFTVSSGNVKSSASLSASHTIDNFTQVVIKTTSTDANAATMLQVVPKGTGESVYGLGRSQISIFNTEDVETNYENLLFRATGTQYLIKAQAGGSGTVRPLSFVVGTSEALELPTTGGVKLSTGTTETSSLFQATGFSDANGNIAITRLRGFGGTNTAQMLQLVPRGTGYASVIRAQLSVFGTDYNADDTNYEACRLYSSGTSYILESLQGGTGQHRPISIQCGGAERIGLDTSGNVSIGTASLATNATNGFAYIPTCSGTPTGTPTAKTGFAPLVIDSTNNKLYAYIGGAWRAMN